ncbi:hypothetical protein OH77DRAFT_1431010 [Trametes cingulata]|nr:hypothetical protein OH77DRAFT_1431010 [Trametes cingulata]
MSDSGTFLYCPAPAFASIESVLGIPPPFYSVAFGNGLARSALHRSTDSSYFSMSLTGAACWLSYMTTIYTVPAVHPPATPQVATSVADAILRRPEQYVSLPPPSQPAQMSTPPCPSLRLYEASLALSNASAGSGGLQDTQCSATSLPGSSIIAEPMPSFDDIPEIPDEDVPPALSSSLPSHGKTNNASAPNTSPTASNSHEHATQPSLVKPFRKAQKLVRQYMAHKRETRPSSMGRPSLPTILEDAVLECGALSVSVSVSLPRRVPKPKKRRAGPGRPKTSRGDENLRPFVSASSKTDEYVAAPRGRARVSSFSTANSANRPPFAIAH